MAIQQSKVLSVGIDRLVFERLAPIFRSNGIDVDWTPTIEAGLVLVTNQPFDVIILSARPSGTSLKDVLRVIRSGGSASSEKAIIALASPEEADAARAFEGNGINRVMLVSDPPDLILEKLLEISDVAPRSMHNLPIRIDASGGKNGQVLFCQTENLSRSGMLVKTRHQPVLGSTVTFKIHLSDAGTIAGRGEMVRYSTEGQGNVVGVGIRFLDFSGNGALRLQRYLEPSGSGETPAPLSRSEKPLERRRGVRQDFQHKVTLEFE